MKQFITLILMVCVCTSCMSSRQTFLARKHNVSKREITMIQETKIVSPYSPYFELKEIVELTSKGMTKENYDSISYVYKMWQNKQNPQSNCDAYDVMYKIEKDTLYQRIYMINNREVKVTHDKDIIIKMDRQVRHNFLKMKKLTK